MKKQLLLFLLLLFSVSLSAQEKIVTSEFVHSKSTYLPGSSADLLVRFNIDPAWHINANDPGDEMAIPTEIVITPPHPGINIGRMNYPDAEYKTFSFSDVPLYVYEGEQYSRFTISIAPSVPPGDYILSGLFAFQGCDDNTCLAPDEIVFNTQLTIGAEGSASEDLNQALFAKHNYSSLSIEKIDSGENELAEMLASDGLLYLLLIIFFGGLALNLTPCVFPLIPITISYFGSKASSGEGSLPVHGILYTTGIAIMYAILGTSAALAGGIIGGILREPAVIVIIALLILALASSMFGAFEIRVPQSLAQIGGKNRGGYIGTLIMGLTVGIIAAPCIGPFVLALVTFVAQEGDWFFGFISFLFLGLGLGLPYAFLAVFSNALNALPRAGLWMVWVRHIFGFILVALTAYFLQPLLPGDVVYYSIIAIVLFAGAVYLTFIDKSMPAGKGMVIAKYVIFLLFLGASVSYAYDAYSEYQLSEKGSDIAWTKYDEAVLEKAKTEQKPVFIDFYADWCAPCKELERISFREKTFIDESSNFIMIKADLTDDKNEKVQQLKNKFQIKGVPTLIILNRDGSIHKTLVGFQEAETLVEAMKSVK
jgi:thiol:disulfide interchange protein DsbD